MIELDCQLSIRQDCCELSFEQLVAPNPADRGQCAQSNVAVQEPVLVNSPGAVAATCSSDINPEQPVVQLHPAGLRCSGPSTLHAGASRLEMEHPVVLRFQWVVAEGQLAAAVAASVRHAFCTCSTTDVAR